MSHYLLISDAAKEVKVESHVLRYWEEELNLPINRNELGHRYYTEEDVERFKQIKSMKERGLQLKAIKMILKDGKLSVMPETSESNLKKEGIGAEKTEAQGKQGELAIDIIHSRESAQTAVSERKSPEKANQQVAPETREDKARRLQWLLQQLIRETLQENNRELCRDIKENVVKELDYQFRMQEERAEERERRNIERGEAYYQKMDELLRKKTRRCAKEEPETPVKKEKKKRHSLF